MNDNPPSIAEIAALTARLRALSNAGVAADPAERARFLADRDALLDRITAATSCNGKPDLPQRERVPDTTTTTAAHDDYCAVDLPLDRECAAVLGAAMEHEIQALGGVEHRPLTHGWNDSDAEVYRQAGQRAEAAAEAYRSARLIEREAGHQADPVDQHHEAVADLPDDQPVVEELHPGGDPHTDVIWTDTLDGHDAVSVIPLAEAPDTNQRDYWADNHGWTGPFDDDQIDTPPAELGLTGAEGPPIDSGPTLTAEEAAHELAADGRPLDETRAVVRGYLNDVSERVGTSVHLWGLDKADLAAMRADPIERAWTAAAVLDAASEERPADTTEAEQADEDGWSR